MANIPWPITTTTEATQPWPATADGPSEADGDPLDIGGLRPIPVASMWPSLPAPTLRDILPAARTAGWDHRTAKAIVGDEHQWQRAGVLVTWNPRSCYLNAAWDRGTDEHPSWDWHLHAYVDPKAAIPQLTRALNLLRDIGVDVPGVTP